MKKQFLKNKILIYILPQNQIRLIILSALLLLQGFQDDIFSQQIKTGNSEKTIVKIRLPVLPDDKDKNYLSLEDEVAGSVIEVLDRLFIDEVLVCIRSDSSLTKFDSSFSNMLPVDYETRERINEVLVINQTNIHQEGVPPEIDDGYFFTQNNKYNKNPDEDSETYSDNILTSLTMQAEFINIKSGNFLGPFDLEISHVGGARKKSKEKLFKA